MMLVAFGQGGVDDVRYWADRIDHRAHTHLLPFQPAHVRCQRTGGALPASARQIPGVGDRRPSRPLGGPLLSPPLDPGAPSGKRTTDAHPAGGSPAAKPAKVRPLLYPLADLLHDAPIACCRRVYSAQ